MASVTNGIHTTVQHLLDVQQLQAQLQSRLADSTRPSHQELLALCLDVRTRQVAQRALQRVPRQHHVIAAARLFMDPSARCCIECDMCLM